MTRRSFKPKAIDLFSGCGGMTVGLKQAGFNVVGAVEIDPLAVCTYRTNHRRVRVWDCDIRDLDPIEVKRTLGLRKGQLDLLAGCPPCQGFSVLRTLNGSRIVDDPRNDLVDVFLRFVRELRPKTVLMENVPALQKDARFKALLQALDDLGYWHENKILDAADYGVPQRRQRLLLLAGYKRVIAFAAPNRRQRLVRHVIGRLPAPGSSGDALHDLPEKRSERILELISKIPHDGGSRRDLGEDHQLPCHQRCDGFKDIYGRMSWSNVAPTLTTGCFNPSKGRFLHPEDDRVITMREAALLQTFPRWYQFPTNHGKAKVAGLIGNALPPKFLRVHAAEVVRALTKRTVRTEAVHA